MRGRQLDVEDPLLGGDERVELVGDLARAPPARPFSASRRRKLTTSSSAPCAIRVEHVGLHAASRLRVLEQRRELGRVRSTASRSCCSCACTASSVALLLRGLEERARIDAVRDGYDRLPSSCEKSISASASSIRRCWSAPVSDLRVIFSAASEAELADLVADLAERLLRSPARSGGASPRAGAGGPPRSPARTRSRCASATRRASPRISSDSDFAWPISLRCSSSRLRASSRARSASSIALLDALAPRRRSSAGSARTRTSSARRT